MADRPAVVVVLAASLRRSAVEQATDALPNLLYLFSLGVGISSQVFFAKLVDSAPNPTLGAYQGHFAVYLLLGVSLLDVQNAVVGGLSKAIRDAQVSGSLESLLATPTPRSLLLFALMLPAVLASLARMILYAILGCLLFGLSLRSVNPLGVLAVMALALASFAAFTLIGAGLTMLLRRADPVSRLLAAMSVVSGGVFYPSAVLPKWLGAAGALLPIAPALKGLRAAMMQGAGPIDLRDDLFSLCVTVVFVGPFGVWFFGKMLARAREDGSMTAW